MLKFPFSGLWLAFIASTILLLHVGSQYHGMCALLVSCLLSFKCVCNC